MCTWLSSCIFLHYSQTLKKEKKFWFVTEKITLWLILKLPFLVIVLSCLLFVAFYFVLVFLDGADFQEIHRQLATECINMCRFCIYLYLLLWMELWDSVNLWSISVLRMIGRKDVIVGRKLFYYMSGKCSGTKGYCV